MGTYQYEQLRGRLSTMVSIDMARLFGAILLLASLSTALADVRIDWKNPVPIADRAIAVEVGDVLNFEWAGDHTVYEMADKDAFDNCGFGQGSAFRLSETSPYTHTITKNVTYFTCAIDGHCANGQKLSAIRAVTVNCTCEISDIFGNRVRVRRGLTQSKRTALPKAAIVERVLIRHLIHGVVARPLEAEHIPDFHGNRTVGDGNRVFPVDAYICQRC